MGTAFYAFPSQPMEIGLTILAALSEREKRLRPGSVILPWPKVPNIGLRLDDQIRQRIDAATHLVADITIPNFNVYYEIGFAIARGKPIIPTLNETLHDAKREVGKLGLFDVIGYLTYSNSAELETKIQEINITPLLSEYAKDLDYQQPLFLLQSLAKTDFQIEIASAIKKARVFFRSYDPAEVSRFSATDGISFVSASSGVIIPLVSSIVVDADRHNLRAAYLAGLAHGLQRKTLIIQLNDSPAPADYRAHIESVRHPTAVAEKVTHFARDALLYLQEVGRPRIRRRQEQPKIARLSLGASAAENEFRQLEDYFIQTFQFRRALDGRGKIVVGRKGSGKTAIFFQVRDAKRQDRRNFVVDLKPESHQLSLLRENIVSLYDIGVFDHTISAFWQYLIHIEILLRLRAEFLSAANRSTETLKLAGEIERVLQTNGAEMSGDFTTRLSTLVKGIILELDARVSRSNKPTYEELTNIIFRIDLKSLRALLEKCLPANSTVIFLFDNIDKGWSAKGVLPNDVRLVRLLIEALNKMQRDLTRYHVDLHFLVFLRNDIYELMIDETPDRGKESQILIDWSDSEQLKRVILERIQYSLNEDYSSFHRAWREFFTPTVKGVDSFEYLTGRCLMRPRFLIDLVENCIGIAVNRGHQRVEEADVLLACRQHSYYLVSDFGYEIRDVSTVTHDVFYAFIGIGETFEKQKLIDTLAKAEIQILDHERIIDLLLWYGFLGLVVDEGHLFIYDVEYDFKRLKAQMNNSEEIRYCINPAFIDGLMT